MYLAGLSPMRLVSYVKNPIRYGMSDGRAHITVDAVGKLKAALKGKGVVYSWFQGVGRYAALNCQFDGGGPSPERRTSYVSGKDSACSFVNDT